MRTGRAYTSTVSSKGLVAAGISLGTATGLVPWLAGLPGPVPIVEGVVFGLVVCAAGAHQATVRLAVGDGRVVLGQGPWRWPKRVVPFSLVSQARAEDISILQVFGIGVPWHWRSTRMTVRAGPTLALLLTTGEMVRVSTPHPEVAIAIISSGAPSESTAPFCAARPGTAQSGTAPFGTAQSTARGRGEPGEPTDSGRPWFGPKRVGYGISPKTWQGWLVTLAPVVLISIILALVH
jgi:hypothetical protein